MLTDYELAERDRRKASLNVYGLRSCLDERLCQHCGSTDGFIMVWTNPEDIADDGHVLENCPICNPV